MICLSSAVNGCFLTETDKMFSRTGGDEIGERERQ
jgi:hypothetical protein